MTSNAGREVVVRHAQPPVVVDLGVGAAAVAVELLGGAAVGLGRVAGPIARVALHPPLVPRALTLGAALERLADRGRRERASVVRAGDAALDVIVPGVADALLARVDLTDLVLRHVDLERLADEVIRRVDLNAVILERVDLARIVVAALDALDLTEIVLQRVDLATVVAAALARTDLNGVVVEQVDLARVVTAALDALDLTTLVLERVDLDALVATVDLDAVVARIDLPGLATYVVDEIDLPEIVRDSTGSVASGAVRGIRMQSVDADEKVSRLVDRLLLRRKSRSVDAPGEPESLSGRGEDR